MQRIIFLLVIIVGYTNFGLTQSPLPRYLTEDEKLLTKNYISEFDGEFSVSPPEAVRTSAEWEELQSVIITWKGFNTILSEIVKNLKDVVNVIIVCDNENVVKTYLTNKNIDYSTNVSFYEIPSNSIWVRDYGPNSAYLEDSGELIWIDWIYNRPRYKDNSVPEALGEILNIPVYSTNAIPEDLVNTGGNFMSDGLGTGFSSNLVLDENGFNNTYGFSNHSEEDVDVIMEKYMGIDRYIKMEALPYDLIHHIDMHMKLIDEETIIVGEYPEDIADGPQIEANIQYILNNFETPYGNPYNIVRIPMPPAQNGQYPDFGGDYRTYANALIANSKIIVPFYEEKYDTTAQRIWEEQMPGYEVIGIDCNSIIPLSGALHCITKEVSASEPIAISMPKYKEHCSEEPFIVKASVFSSDPIEEVNLVLIENNSQSEIPMTLVNGTYEASLGFYDKGNIVTYYVEAYNANGKYMTRPLVGENGPRSTEIINCSIVNTYITELNDIKIYPNPANAITCIETDIKLCDNLEVSLFDIAGKKMNTLYNDGVGAYAQKIFFNAGDYNPGTYFIHLKANGKSVTKKIIIAE